jgi:hypothetical protein
MNLDSYYSLKPLIPRWLQIRLRQRIIRRLVRRNGNAWPISESAGTAPPAFPGWPGGKRFAVVLTHDVESEAGVSHCEQLADMEQERGLRSNFGFVPLRYQTPERLRRTLVERGFEVIVHDLYHDGRLYRSRKVFEQRLPRINEFLGEWQTRGFSSGSMLHNLSWIGELDIDYDISTYDVDPFEPQACGLGRIFPCWVQPPNRKRPGFAELPYTIPQDFTVFILLREKNNAIWRRKLDWIAEKGGMALIKTHPDYMAFSAKDRHIDRYPVEHYTDFLDYVQSRYKDEFWLASPSAVASYWRGLRPEEVPHGNVIAAGGAFCPSCRRACAEGWLSDYPRQTVAAQTASSATRCVVPDGYLSD